MAAGDEPFLSRWSRLKHEARRPPEPVQPKPTEPQPAAQAPAAARAPGPAPVGQPAADAPPSLPPIEQLTPESDFRPFMASNVPPATRQAALKKLFADAYFNVPDPFEVFSEDYTEAEPKPRKLLDAFEHARRLLARQLQERSDAAPQPAAEPPAAEKPSDGAERQNA